MRLHGNLLCVDSCFDSHRPEGVVAVQVVGAIGLGIRDKMRSCDDAVLVSLHGQGHTTYLAAAYLGNCIYSMVVYGGGWLVAHAAMRVFTQSARTWNMKYIARRPGGVCMWGRHTHTYIHTHAHSHTHTHTHTHTPSAKCHPHAHQELLRTEHAACKGLALTPSQNAYANLHAHR